MHASMKAIIQPSILDLKLLISTLFYMLCHAYFLDFLFNIKQKCFMTTVNIGGIIQCAFLAL